MIFFVCFDDGSGCILGAEFCDRDVAFEPQGEGGGASFRFLSHGYQPLGQ